MKNTTLIILIIAAVLALVTLAPVQTRAPYEIKTADDKSFTMEVPGDYVQLENLEYLRQSYGISGNSVMGFGIPKSRGVLVIRKVLDSSLANIDGEEMADALVAQMKEEGEIDLPEKIIANDKVFLKMKFGTMDPKNGGYPFVTYHNGSMYVFSFYRLGPESDQIFEKEILTMLESITFNPDPNI